MAAVSSISWAVVLDTEPEIVHSCLLQEKIAAQPPGPGLPMAEPSVAIRIRLFMKGPTSAVGRVRWTILSWEDS